MSFRFSQVHQFKVTTADQRAFVIQLQADKLTVMDGTKLLHKQAYAGNGVKMQYTHSPTGFILVRAILSSGTCTPLRELTGPPLHR